MQRTGCRQCSVEVRIEVTMASAATAGTLACLYWLVPLGLAGCMFQEPFYFTSAPKINAILDSRGRPVADK